MSLIFITFIFKLNEKTFYGKFYTDTLEPDHEGLNEVIKPYLMKGLQDQDVLPENVRIGILSVCNHKYIAIHSSKDEINCFDFYCHKFTINYTVHVRMYMFGKLVDGKLVGGKLVGGKLVGGKLVGDKLVGDKLVGDKLVGDKLVDNKLCENPAL